MLNPNLASKISYERILNNFHNWAVNRSGVLPPPFSKTSNFTYIKMKLRFLAPIDEVTEAEKTSRRPPYDAQEVGPSRDQTLST